MKYVFFISEATSKKHLHLYKDIEKEPNVIFISPWGGDNIFSKLLRQLLIKIGKIFKKNIVKSINSNRLRIKPDKDYCVIVEGGYLAACNNTFYQKFRKYDNVKIYLLLVDSMSAHSPVMHSIKEQILNNDWDEIFTFEKDDADKYNWNYSGVNCSSLPIRTNSRIKSDLYFIGGLKGERSELLFSVYDFLNRNGVRCKYDLLYQSKSEQVNSANCIYKIVEEYKKTGIKDIGTINLRKHFLKYEKALVNVQECNVIFEVIQKGQSAQTMRWFEAVYYNKKLLTNNPNVKNLPLYNEKFMKFVNSADDIDIDWIMSKEDIDYGYRGEMSPVRLMEKIRAKAENR